MTARLSNIFVSIQILLLLYLSRVGRAGSSYDEYKVNCWCTEEALSKNYCQRWECDEKAVYKCFPADASVNLSVQISKKISELVPGDEIMTIENGTYTSDIFIGYLHKLEEVVTDFLRFQYNSSNMELHSQQNSIRISDLHLIYSRPKESQKAAYVFAKNVAKGDSILVNNTWVEVLSIYAEKAKGIYAPLTMSGTLLVDGVLVSNYAYLNEHELIHKAFAPLRAIYYLLGKYGVDHYIKGVNWYASLLMKISEKMDDKLNYKSY